MSSEVTDQVLGPWVYCLQHLRAHQSGWCTIPTSDKVGLGDFKGSIEQQTEAAQEKCRRFGLRLYEDVVKNRDR